MKAFSLFISFICFVAALRAQQPDSALSTPSLLNEVEIYSNSAFGEEIKSFDSLLYVQHLGGSVADLIQASGYAYVKQMAPGQLSTLSVRGGNASQTQVMWSGVNLNNLVLGQTDFSLLPAWLFSDVQMNLGAVGANTGNGSVTGVVRLGNRIQHSSSGLFVHQGSFGQQTYGAISSLRKDKYSFVLKPFYTSVQNNYSYTDADGAQQKMENAAVLGYGALLSSAYDSKGYLLSLDVWIQRFDREIPLIIGAYNNHAQQTDFNFKSVVNFNRKNARWFAENRLAFFNDVLNYQSDFSDGLDYMKLNTIIGESESKWNFRNNVLRLRYGLNLGMAQNSGYDEGLHYLHRNHLMLDVSNRKQVRNAERFIGFSIREENNNSMLSIPVVQLGYSKSYCFQPQSSAWIPCANFHVNTGTVYRFPTMNDLYWKNGGNINLLPEKGLSGNAGIVVKAIQTTNHSNLVEFSFTHYQRYLYDQIIWYPNGMFWSPQNLQEVWSRGTETSLRLQFGKKVRGYIHGLLNYTVSTLENSAIENDNAIGKQLLYVPMYNSSLRAGVQYKGIDLSWQNLYYGYRYTSSDNYEYLSPFYLNNMALSAHFTFADLSGKLFFQVENIFDIDYRWMAMRPAMPRNYSISVLINLNHKNQ